MWIIIKKDRNNIIATTVRNTRKEFGLTPVEFAINSNLGLRFVRELEQGKKTARLDKVYVTLNSLGYDLRPVKFERIK